MRAVEDGPKLLDRLKSRSSTPYYEQQIKDIVKEACEVLREPTDELFLYGSGHGAFIVRAVAALLDVMQMPKAASLRYFDRLYQSSLDVYRARHEDDNRNGPKIVEFLRSHTAFAPNIQFVGVFDTVKYTAEGHRHDMSLVRSIRHMRHALALNETRAQLSPEPVELPATAEKLQGRSFVQAWFLGSHVDVAGGAPHDGLSLHPLQWIIMDSLRAGLVLRPKEPNDHQNGTESPLSLAFPQFAGDVPTLDAGEEIQWQMALTNGITITMFDLQMSHGDTSADDQKHSLRINSSNMLYNRQREAFGSKGRLTGYCATGTLERCPPKRRIKGNGIDSPIGGYGTIIHPSVFCLLDRYPRFYEHSHVKSLRKKLAEYRDRSLQETEAGLPPWLEGLQLQASGVKAFRILVCGKTGVGKSTLINKVFGVELVPCCSLVPDLESTD